MPFDPTLPQEDTEIEAAQMRSQLNSLKALIDAGLPGPQGLPGPPGADGADGADGEVTNAALASALASALLDTPHNCTGVNPLSLTPSDPPTQAEVQAILDKLNELLAALRREP